MEIPERWLALAAGCLIILLCLVACPVLAQDHSGHRKQDMPNHLKFYNSWMQPDNRSVSCCHDKDCRSAEAHMKNGQWYARQDGDDGDFTPIPPQKVEQERDSPDGRSHLCGQRYGFNGNQFSVFCFLPAAGH